MSSTVSGATIPINFSNATGAQTWFDEAWAAASSINPISLDGVSTLTGGDVLINSNLAVTVSGSLVDDKSSGNNSITTVNPANVWAQPGDTITSAAATTIWGASSGTTTFSLTGAGDSVTGGSGYIVGSSSGANSTLIGGTGGGAFTVGGSGSLAVAGQAPGTTNITLTETSGGSEIDTNPGTDQGTLIATLSATGADTVIGGGGASTITGGSGDDVFGFVSGHAGGSETILNFTTSDNFAFSSGYGANPIQTETYAAGANGAGTDVITLSDGTVITVEGQFSHSIFGKDS
jgi:hypothetical protein